MGKIVLASSSLRRREILERAGVAFVVDPPGIEEDMTRYTTPRALVMALASQKAAAVALRYKSAIVIAADTVAAQGRKVWSKPVSKRAARLTLRSLAGKPHDVWTGFCIMDTKTGRRVVRAAKTRVWFRSLAPKEIARYAELPESLEGAGGYQMQLSGHALTERIEGDFNNVIGLPLGALLKELRRFGVKG